jgi:hypothetical protein
MHAIYLFAVRDDYFLFLELLTGLGSKITSQELPKALGLRNHILEYLADCEAFPKLGILAI